MAPTPTTAGSAELPAETAPPTPVPDDQKTKRERSKLLVPEDAQAIGKWLDTYSYDSNVPVAIYVQDGKYYFSTEPPSERVLRVKLDKLDETNFLSTAEEYGEHLEIKNGDLHIRDNDGPIGTAKPLVE